MSLTLPDAFRKVIAKSLHIEPDDKNIVRISEDDVCAKCKNVEIKLTDLTASFCFKIDFEDKDGCDAVYIFS